jgi:hypothetical protein
MTGIIASGLGTGVGGCLNGVALGGLGAGASSVRGVLLVGTGTGSSDVRGTLLSTGYNRVEGGVLRGIQIGVLNAASNNPPGLRVLPLVNANL